jgi:hypothetical protein
MEGETSMRPMAGIYARFASNRVTRLADIEVEDNRSIHSSFLRHASKVNLNMYLFFILYYSFCLNVNFNIELFILFALTLPFSF